MKNSPTSSIRNKSVRLILALGALTLLLAALSLAVGAVRVPLGEVLSALFGGGDSAIVLYARAPRVCACLLAGGALAVSGALTQSVLANPLAAPSTIGVNSGAGLAAALCCALAPSATALVPVAAFLGGLLSALLVLFIAGKTGASRLTLVLAGVALSSLFTGGSTLLQYFADDTQLGAVVFWTFGDLGSTNWSELAMLLAVDVAALIYFLLKRWDYNAIHSGSDTAASLGVNVKAVTLVSMTVCTVASALAVSFVGIISFIGLVAPHAMRRFVGDDYRWLLPCSAAGGALLLILADLVSRVLIAPTILPVGAITSFLGAPVFLYLLLKGGSRRA